MSLKVLHNLSHNLIISLFYVIKHLLFSVVDTFNSIIMFIFIIIDIFSGLIILFFGILWFLWSVTTNTLNTSTKNQNSIIDPLSPSLMTSTTHALPPGFSWIMKHTWSTLAMSNSLLHKCVIIDFLIPLTDSLTSLSMPLIFTPINKTILVCALYSSEGIWRLI